MTNLRTMTAIYSQPQPRLPADFAKHVAFENYVRWRMLKHLLQSGVSFNELAKRMEIKRTTIDKIVLREDVDIPMSHVAAWFYCIDGSRVNFGIV